MFLNMFKYNKASFDSRFVGSICSWLRNLPHFYWCCVCIFCVFVVVFAVFVLVGWVVIYLFILNSPLVIWTANLIELSNIRSANSVCHKFLTLLSLSFLVNDQIIHHLIWEAEVVSTITDSMKTQHTSLYMY